MSLIGTPPLGAQIALGDGDLERRAPMYDVVLTEHLVVEADRCRLRGGPSFRLPWLREPAPACESWASPPCACSC